MKFIDEMEKIITSRKKVTVKKEVGWYTEAEMKSELKWTQWLWCNWFVLRYTYHLPNSFIGFSPVDPIILYYIIYFQSWSLGPGLLQRRATALIQPALKPIPGQGPCFVGRNSFLSFQSFRPWRCEEEPLWRPDGVLGHSSWVWLLWGRTRGWRNQKVAYEGS